MRTRALILLVLAALFGVSPGWAQSGGTYDLSWTTIDAGGVAMASGGTYALDGSIGQSDAGELTGGTYKMAGGLWGGGMTSVAVGVAAPVPKGPLGLRTSRPNPFSGTTTIDFLVPKHQRMELQVYDLRGRLVRSLFDESLNAGQHSIIWDGRDNAGQRVASAVYLIRLSSAEVEASAKVVFLGK